MSQRFLNVKEILDALQALEADSRTLLAKTPTAAEAEALQNLLIWLAGHERSFATLLDRLQQIPSADELIGEWFAHAPSHERCPIPGGGSETALLLTRAIALEEDLLQLIGDLLQHSDGIWIRELYGSLLSHPAPSAALRKLCPPRAAATRS